MTDSTRTAPLHRFIVSATTADHRPFGIWDRDRQRFVASYADHRDAADALETFYGWTPAQVRAFDFDSITGPPELEETAPLTRVRLTTCKVENLTRPVKFETAARKLAEAEGIEYRRGYFLVPDTTGRPNPSGIMGVRIERLAEDMAKAGRIEEAGRGKWRVNVRVVSSKVSRKLWTDNPAGVAAAIRETFEADSTIPELHPFEVMADTLKARASDVAARRLQTVGHGKRDELTRAILRYCEEAETLRATGDIGRMSEASSPALAVVMSLHPSPITREASAREIVSRAGWDCHGDSKCEGAKRRESARLTLAELRGETYDVPANKLTAQVSCDLCRDSGYCTACGRGYVDTSPANDAGYSVRRTPATSEDGPLWAAFTPAGEMIEGGHAYPVSAWAVALDHLALSQLSPGARAAVDYLRGDCSAPGTFGLAVLTSDDKVAEYRKDTPEDRNVPTSPERRAEMIEDARQDYSGGWQSAAQIVTVAGETFPVPEETGEMSEARAYALDAGFEIEQATGPRAAECIRAAVTHARVTGSVGATYSVGGDVTEESTATVARSGAARVMADNLNRNRYATSPYARGYRVGARAVLDTDTPPPPPGHGDRAEYRQGFEDGQKDLQAVHGDKPAPEDSAQVGALRAGARALEASGGTIHAAELRRMADKLAGIEAAPISGGCPTPEEWADVDVSAELAPALLKRDKPSGNLAGIRATYWKPELDTWATVYRAEDAGIDAGAPWAVVCERHGSILGVDTLKLAHSDARADTAEFCEGCRQVSYRPADKPEGEEIATVGGRLQCRYTRASVQCERAARDGWTTCARHYTAGMNRASWDRTAIGRAFAAQVVTPATPGEVQAARIAREAMPEARREIVAAWLPKLVNGPVDMGEIEEALRRAGDIARDLPEGERVAWLVSLPASLLEPLADFGPFEVEDAVAEARAHVATLAELAALTLDVREIMAGEGGADAGAAYDRHVSALVKRLNSAAPAILQNVPTATLELVSCEEGRGPELHAEIQARHAAEGVQGGLSADKLDPRESGGTFPGWTWRDPMSGERFGLLEVARSIPDAVRALRALALVSFVMTWAYNQAETPGGGHLTADAQAIGGGPVVCVSISADGYCTLTLG